MVTCTGSFWSSSSASSTSGRESVGIQHRRRSEIAHAGLGDLAIARIAGVSCQQGEEARSGHVVLALHDRLGQVLGVRRGRGEKAAGFGVDEGPADEIAGGGGGSEPLALARRAVQRQQGRAHLDIVGEVGSAGIARGVTEAAAEQAALAQRPLRAGHGERQCALLARCVVVGEQSLDGLAGLAGVLALVDAGLAFGHAHRGVEAAIRSGERVLEEAEDSVGGRAVGRLVEQHRGAGVGRQRCLLGEHRIFARGCRPVGFQRDLTDAAKRRVDQGDLRREAALEPCLGLLVSRLRPVEEPAEGRAVHELALAPAAVVAVVGLVEESQDLGALGVAQARRQGALPLRTGGVTVIDRRGIADRLLQDGNEEFRRVEAAQLHDLRAVRPEDDGGGPAPALVALGDVGAAVLVDVDRNELVPERGAHLGVGPGIAVHDVAPRAPPALQRHDHELLLGGGAPEGGVRPVAPEAVLVVERRGLSRRQTQQQCRDDTQEPHHESLRCHHASKPFAGSAVQWSNHGQTQDREEPQEEPVAITVQPITPTFAAEVGDVTLGKPLAPDDLAAIRAAFTKYAVLVFPDQEFDDESQLAFARHFGPLETTVFKARKDHKLRLHENLADVGNLDAENRILPTDDRQR
ncbi:MAG TPA: TauD/TfdA family dioxygenase, partial [Reyranella sp.]